MRVRQQQHQHQNARPSLYDRVSTVASHLVREYSRRHARHAAASAATNQPTSQPTSERRTSGQIKIERTGNKSIEQVHGNGQRTGQRSRRRSSRCPAKMAERRTATHDVIDNVAKIRPVCVCVRDVRLYRGCGCRGCCCTYAFITHRGAHCARDAEEL